MNTVIQLLQDELNRTTNQLADATTNVQTQQAALAQARAQAQQLEQQLQDLKAAINALTAP